MMTNGGLQFGILCSIEIVYVRSDARLPFCIKKNHEPTANMSNTSRSYLHRPRRSRAATGTLLGCSRIHARTDRSPILAFPAPILRIHSSAPSPARDEPFSMQIYTKENEYEFSILFFLVHTVTWEEFLRRLRHSSRARDG